MLDRARAVDGQFITRMQSQAFPPRKSSARFDGAGLDPETAYGLLDSQIKSRLLDLKARELKEKGLSFYTIGSSGHEGNAVMGLVFPYTDMAFLHYRSGAFYLQRAKQLGPEQGIRDILLSLVASSADPISGGRHKVFGSVPLNIPPQTSTIASHLPKALGAALSITRMRELHLQGKLGPDSVVLCSFGDASVNHASAQTTFNACSWLASQNYPLPLVFICEDNGMGISVPTPCQWIEKSVSQRPGIHYIDCDGLNCADIYLKAREAARIARVRKQPVFLHMRCVRLLGHAGSDIESQYLHQAEIEKREADDPLLHTAAMLVEAGWMSSADILELYEKNRQLVDNIADEVIVLPKSESKEDIMSSIIPPANDTDFPVPGEAVRERVFGKLFYQLRMKRNMCQLINFALSDLLIQYPSMLVFGEDVGKKGGVYRVTADLQARFGQRRVFDTLLDETTILGTATGLAHNGFIPVPEIQFLAYLHNAEDQLRGEAATLSFFSSGQYCNPMVIRVAALAYQKGFGGHFHNDNSIAVLRDLPGVVVACPSNGADAAKMLRTCLNLAAQKNRVVVFLEPIALYMTKDLHVPGDNEWLCEYPAPGEYIEPGHVGIYGEGETLIISYANGYYLSRQAVKILQERHHIPVKIIDLRWLSPLPAEAVLRETKGMKNILIVDEGRKSGSLSEGLMTLLVENDVKARVRRLTGEDSFIPLGNAWQCLLPSRDAIINAVLDLNAVTKERKNGRLAVSG